MNAVDVVIWASAKNNNQQQRTWRKPEVLNTRATENNMIIKKSKTMYQYFSL
jgi:hypothetical protein